METWSTGCYGQALEEAFLSFDESLIKPEIIEELKSLVGVPEEGTTCTLDIILLSFVG